ncbi:MAG: hypothetical protein WBQ50_18435 [Nocardioides sp.]
MDGHRWVLDPIELEHLATKTQGMVFWAVLVLPTLALLVAISVRRVSRDELVLVVRRGRVVRSGATGWLARLPGLERFVAVSTHRQVLPLVVRGRTRDGVNILALADLTLAVQGVPDLVEYDDPATAAVLVAEDVVAEAFGGLAAVTLVDNLGDLEGCLPAAITRRLVPGSVATGLAVTEIEAQLTPRLARDLRPDEQS